MSKDTPEAEHTPGPWECRSSNGGWGERHVVICTSEYPSTPGSYVADVLRGGEGGVRLANAHLIAAAPDLLDALEMAIPYIEHGMPESCGRCGTPDAQCDFNCMDAAYGAQVLRIVRAAIAKATGGA